MVVGMRRTTRVFGVVKSGDEARILRSGRKLWSEPDVGMLKMNNNSVPRDEWLKLSDKDYRKKVPTGWCRQVSVRKEEEEEEAHAESRYEACDSVGVREKASEMKIVNVYERKQRMFDLAYGDFRKDCGMERMFGNHFVHRQWRRKTVFQTSDSGNLFRPVLVVECTAENGAR